MSHSDREDQVFAKLIPLAEQAPSPSELAKRRARAAAHATWQKTVRRRQHRRWGALAAVASLVLAVGVFWTQRQQLPAAIPLATLASVSGAVQIQLAGTEVSMNGSAIDLYAGDGVTTATNAYARLTLPSGHEIRLAPDTTLSMTEPDQLNLIGGRVFAATRGDREHSIVITTAYGPVTDIGTQFQVGVDDHFVVRVREGRVQVDDRTIVEAGQAAYGTTTGQLNVEDDDAAEWEWITAAAPFAIDGRTLDEFLVWLCSEQGWTLRYEDAQLASRAQRVVLSGSIEGLDALQALDAVLPTMALSWVVEGQSLYVNALEP